MFVIEKWTSHYLVKFDQANGETSRVVCGIFSATLPSRSGDAITAGFSNWLASWSSGAKKRSFYRSGADGGRRLVHRPNRSTLYRPSPTTFSSGLLKVNCIYLTFTQNVVAKYSSFVLHGSKCAAMAVWSDGFLTSALCDLLWRWMMIFAVQLRMNNDLVSSYADCQRRGPWRRQSNWERP